MKLAFDNISGGIFALNSEMMARGIEGSRQSKRKRVILPIHRTQDALVQRMLNFMQPETYIRPHMHAREEATETVVLLKGALRFIVFSGEGEIEQKIELSANEVNGVIDIEPNIWHSFLVLEKDTVILEMKRGPYDTALDKTFAAWSPEEFTKESICYMQSW
ncbi:MAG: WbuC family cupin fold metalloprotein [Verrucomicrobiota bacterium]